MSHIFVAGNNKLLLPSRPGFICPQYFAIPSGLSGYWGLSLDCINGSTAIDISRTGWNGTIVANPTSVDGQVGRSLSFNGSTQWVAIPARYHAAITLAAWVNGSAFSKAYNSVVSKGEPGGISVATILIKSTGKLAIYIGSANYDGTGTNTLATGRWYFVCATYVLGALRGYVNGRLDGSASGTASPIANGGVGDNYRIASHPSIGGREFTGAIQEVRIYNRALSAGEVLELYCAGLRGLRFSNAYEMPMLPAVSPPPSILYGHNIGASFTRKVTTIGY